MNLQVPAKIEQSGLTAAQVLLRELIGYAGLFPPALSMAQCVANYEAYSRSEWSWILGRLIVPAAQLDEWEQAVAARQTAAAVTWRISALLGADPVRDMACVREFNGGMAESSPKRFGCVGSVELKVSTVGEVTEISRALPPDLQAYFEFPLSRGSDFVREISSYRGRAKIRTGGQTADKFPNFEEVAEFLRLCAAANVAFKATAGLHHPLRSVHCFTYEPESASGMMHGFLNLFLAAAFLRAGMKPETAARLLEEQSPVAFRVESDGVSWKDHRLSSSQIGAARRDFAISFGSCSFTEPIEDLQSLNIL